MKLPLILIPMITLGLGSSLAQETSQKIDPAATKAALAGAVATTPPRFILKGGGGDPVTKRIYTKDAIVVTHASGATENHPYVAVPLLFQKNSDELRNDANSRENLVTVAKALKDLAPEGASFAIEGHASAEGDPKRNRDLSNLRALKIQALLRDKGVSAGELVRVEGFGSDHAQHPGSAPESELQEDRRVLVVKEK